MLDVRWFLKRVTEPYFALLGVALFIRVPRCENAESNGVKDVIYECDGEQHPREQGGLSSQQSPGRHTPEEQYKRPI